ncbi:ribonucleoside-diphosphate reductase [Amycolatopsis sp. BJA-103]|uniref:LAGLIDADG family homing endonuclease n=1 Tax=Amycolatopsis sp. BJA-103 TaxID=1911175 RepID=UPI000C77E3E4|nr:LAGLIDADG family homing endonuclease [Amycolatopsis sp. BJA-103]AUI57534.1 ribonucleoside-diphosphate reductase [Amycolatopsis sp. BJA-103]PNE13947.1 ribonucleoside-diphosphate reductase [Amycolatopsis sp. BJA-103]
MTETVGSGNPATARTSGKKKQAGGLTVRRVFTTEGVHPYDQVTWESRDVVMTNWRDGTVNFEQRGVEFPDFWSVNATNIVTSKYFRGAVGSARREQSLKQLIDRVVRSYVGAGREHGYFASPADAEVFEHELTWMLLHQVFSFNSPVWFNVGTTSKQQVSACFILSVDDTMESILNWYREEGLIFKGGSGAGLNLSRIRSSRELLSSGGTASGPVSFMRGADASAGTIKSGGATRRAAKMVVLDVDHPDVEEFVQTKAREEEKIKVLRDAGFDMDLSGSDITSVQYQNANNSVRVSDEFMQAVENQGDFGLRARMTGEVIDRVDAKKLFRTISQAAWECADPGLQYDGTINDWHTCPESGRITASNPCFPGDQRVVTDAGLVRIGDLVCQAAAGERFAVYTNDVTHADDPVARIVATEPTRYMVTGTNEIVELRFSDGSRLRCTPNHRVWTANQGWVHADRLTAEDRVVRSIEYAPSPYASAALPPLAVQVAHQARGKALRAVPEKWDTGLAHYLGWLVGDGCLTDVGATTVYGSEWERDVLMPRHRALLASITGFESKPSRQSNGTVQLRARRGRFGLMLKALGVSTGRSPAKVVPESIYVAPEDIVGAFLRGLFDADGCVVNQEQNGTRYVGLASRSEELLIGVQELLASLGIRGRIYRTGTKAASFRYVTKNGDERVYGSDGESFDLRITGRHMAGFAELIGFEHSEKSAKLADVTAGHGHYSVDETVRLVSRVSRGFETTFNLTEPRNHSYIVGGTVVANCSEYMHLDNSSCNLASLNLLKFATADGGFDAQQFAKAVELVITAMDISICFADFPTEAIGDTTRKFRQLGIGYANLGALLMALGHAYDSDGGRALAAAITSLMTGVSYRRSAELAAVVGPYEGYARNAEAHQRVMRKHAAASELVRTYHANDAAVRALATQEWKRGIELGEISGWRNAQASVLAPTGCLTADTLVTTDRGLARLSELGDLYGDHWQDVEFTVATDEGPRQATKFFVNGEEPTRRIETKGGYRIQGTLAHRVKVVEPETGSWVWKRLADIRSGDLVPLQLGGLVGDPRRVPLPVLDQAYYAGDRDIRVPDEVTADLAELVGYFEGDGSLHAKGVRLCVADTDLDVVDRLRILSKDLFGLEPAVRQCQGYQEVTLQSVRLARWWQAAGFAKDLPGPDHAGKGWTPRVPASIRETNDPAVYAAFLRGVFEADGTVLEGVPSVSTSSELFGEDLRSLLLALGMVTTTRRTTSGFGGTILQIRLRNVDHAMIFDEIVGFISERKARSLVCLEPNGSAKGDRVHLPRPRLGRALEYLFEPVESNEDGGVQPTYDLSVPDNVTYVANGFVSHNTIGFMMDCDTTGIEPDFSLVKFKKLVGGGSMQIVNQTIPRALTALGYQAEQVEAIVEYIAEHGHVVDAPGLRPEHYEVFDCAVGERSIAPMGHVRMMAAVQPFLSGAISKTVNMPESATVEEVEEIYFQGWKYGLKALAIYRDNCKVGQPLSSGKKEKAEPEAEKVVEYRPVRKRLPKKRPSQTVSFTVGGAEGYLHAGSYPDDGLGEIFVKLGKQGSTLSGVMDAFSMSISVGLQHGIPLEFYVSKFSNLRFEPAGMTDDPDIRIATSVMDYLFRRLALDYLPYEKRAQLGIFTADERSAQVEATYGATPAAEPENVDIDALRSTVDSSSADPAKRVAHSTAELVELNLGTASDAPLCMTCGTKMRPAGSCYACEGCGATSGCS